MLQPGRRVVLYQDFRYDGDLPLYLNAGHPMTKGSASPHGRGDLYLLAKHFNKFLK